MALSQLHNLIHHASIIFSVPAAPASRFAGNDPETSQPQAASEQQRMVSAPQPSAPQQIAGQAEADMQQSLSNSDIMGSAISSLSLSSLSLSVGESPAGAVLAMSYMLGVLPANVTFVKQMARSMQCCCTLLEHRNTGIYSNFSAVPLKDLCNL